MGAAILSDLGTELLVPICAVVGIAFSLFQWLLVARVKMSSEGSANGHMAALIEETEEGIDGEGAVKKCAEIQTAISEGGLLAILICFIGYIWTTERVKLPALRGLRGSDVRKLPPVSRAAVSNGRIRDP